MSTDAPLERGYTMTLVLGVRPTKEIPINGVSTRIEEEMAMAIIVVSRWKGSYEQGLPIVREASPILSARPAPY
jgi:hypothetical protein